MPQHPALTSPGGGRILRAEGDLTVDTSRDRQPTCGFCDGSGLWADSDGDLAAADPCPLCEGTGFTPAGPGTEGEETQATERAAFGRLLTLLPRLSQAERQRLYEELHAIYDCRIYRR
jgi:hypothetical protein